MVEFSKEEQNIIDQCVPFYRGKIMPDTSLKEIKVGDAVEYCHSKGKFIAKPKEHDLMYSIFDKVGIEYETNEVRQARLKKERMEKIAKKRMGKMDSIITEKEAELKKAVKQKTIMEAEVKATTDKQEAITVKEANAQKAQQEAETKATAMEEKMKAMEEQMKKMEALLQKGENEANLKDAAEELAKEEKAKLEPELTKEPPAEVIIEEPPTVIIEPEIKPEPEKEEKTIDELIDTLK